MVLACGSVPDAPVDREAVRDALTFPGERVPHAAILERPVVGEGYAAIPLSLQVRQGFRVGAAWFRPDVATHDAVLVNVGHFGKGKSGPEAQEIAHRLAQRGVQVLIVDPPGLEEWGRPEWALDFQRGAANRQRLLEGGTSALALQLAGSQAGLDFLQDKGAQDVIATGASGGAVLSFWLAVLDERVDGVVLASAPEVPRRPDEGGCPCKTLPGVPGPDPHAVSMLPVPSLWLKESDVPPLAGLPDDATWRHVPGEHSYTTEMQRQAVAWIDEQLGTSGPFPEQVPSWTLQSQPFGDGRQPLTVAELPLRSTR